MSAVNQGVAARRGCVLAAKDDVAGLIGQVNSGVVVARPTVNPIHAQPSIEVVVAGSSLKAVIAAIAVEMVVAGAGDQDIVVVPALDVIHARSRGDDEALGRINFEAVGVVGVGHRVPADGEVA